MSFSEGSIIQLNSNGVIIVDGEIIGSVEIANESNYGSIIVSNYLIVPSSRSGIKNDFYEFPSLKHIGYYLFPDTDYRNTSHRSIISSKSKKFFCSLTCTNFIVLFEIKEKGPIFKWSNQTTRSV